MKKVCFSKDNPVEVFQAAGLDKLITAGEKIAVKLHFGEPGNQAYLKPKWIKPIIERIRKLGGDPFLTDACTLYSGPRQNPKTHAEAALKNGHDYAPIIIADEKGEIAVQVNLKHCKEVYLALILKEIKTIIVLTHFKGHELTGFGGAIKNLGMGFATRKGKLEQHSDCDNCEAKEKCRKKQTLTECWVGSPALVQEKVAEYAYGAVKNKKVGYLNYIVEISPNCDCYSHADPPVCEDVGVLASLDPVAIDQASIDLVNKVCGKDIFREIYPSVDWNVQLSYAEKIGMGSQQYQLISC